MARLLALDRDALHLIMHHVDDEWWSTPTAVTCRVLRGVVRAVREDARAAATAHPARTPYAWLCTPQLATFAIDGLRIPATSAMCDGLAKAQFWATLRSVLRRGVAWEPLRDAERRVEEGAKPDDALAIAYTYQLVGILRVSTADRVRAEVCRAMSWKVRRGHGVSASMATRFVKDGALQICSNLLRNTDATRRESRASLLSLLTLLCNASDANAMELCVLWCNDRWRPVRLIVCYLKASGEGDAHEALAIRTAAMRLLWIVAGRQRDVAREAVRHGAIECLVELLRDLNADDSLVVSDALNCTRSLISRCPLSGTLLRTGWPERARAIDAGLVEHLARIITTARSGCHGAQRAIAMARVCAHNNLTVARTLVRLVGFVPASDLHNPAARGSARRLVNSLVSTADPLVGTTTELFSALREYHHAQA